MPQMEMAGGPFLAVWLDLPSLCERDGGIGVVATTVVSHPFFPQMFEPWTRALGDTKMNKVLSQLSRSSQCDTVEEICIDNYNTGKKVKPWGRRERGSS